MPRTTLPTIFAQPALRALLALATAAALPLLMPAFAQAATAPAPLHLRGTIVSTSATSITVATPSGTDQIALGPHPRILGIVNSSLANVGAGDYIGTTVVPQANGSLRALEVHIFPASLKGTGEGFYAWDKQQQSMMANATVQNVATRSSMMANATVQSLGSGAAGRTVQLTYNGGTKTVTIPPNVPVVALRPGSKALLTAGAHVFVIATRDSSGLVATGVNVGENGVVPPM
jgi:hypothetical protein